MLSKVLLSQLRKTRDDLLREIESLERERKLFKTVL